LLSADVMQAIPKKDEKLRTKYGLKRYAAALTDIFLLICSPFVLNAH
jgi:hypothetical protein